MKNPHKLFNRIAFTAGLLAISLSAAQAALAASPVEPQTEEAEKWDVANPPGDKRKVSIDVDQGTWMSLDVSPDGKTIAFDLLGDIYTMPISGGKATNIASGMPWEFQPRFSPDGQTLSFTSDRAGGENIWLMDVDGSNTRQITSESFRLLNNASWSPDGNYLAARKHFTTRRSLGTGEIWLYHIDGGEGFPVVKRPDELFQKELGEPSYSPDGKQIYYSLDVTPGGTFKYAQDSNGELFQIRAYNTETGEIETIVSGQGGAVTPTPSPDGKQLAFVRRIRARSALFIMDLESGEAKAVYTEMDQDVQEVWATQGLYPNMAWTPDSKNIVFWAGGKIKKLDLASGSARNIEFKVVDEREILATPRPPTLVGKDEFKTQIPKFAQRNPQSSDIIFESLGKLWRKTGEAEAKPLIKEKDQSKYLKGFESQPAYSPDGKWITFVHWHDISFGDIFKVKSNGSGLKKLTKKPGLYAHPQFSNNGKEIVFEKRSGGYLTSAIWSRHPGVYVMNSNGNNLKQVADEGRHPKFSNNGERIFTTVYEERKHFLISTNLNGKDRIKHAFSHFATEFTLAPDTKHLVFRENYNLYLVPLPKSAEAIELNPRITSLPLTRLSKDGGDFAVWQNANTVNWSSGPEFFSQNIDAIEPQDEDESTPVAAIANLSLKVKSDKPQGMVALINAKVITMNDAKGGIIENGIILIEDNRIIAVGEEVHIPAAAKRVDLAGKTVTPGFIDAHAHGPHGTDDIIPQRNWASHGTLALGVTTTHNPSSVSRQIFTAAEMANAGLILAPRTYSTGEIIYGARSEHLASIDSYDDALSHVKRLKAQGAISVKNYNQPRREQRQQVANAARAENIMVVAEGGSLFHMDMSLVVDGQTAIEHNLPQWAIYDDVVQLWSQTDVGYTPTFVVSYNGPSAERYWYQETNVWQHPILSLHVPPHILQPASVRRVKAPIEDYAHIPSAKIAKKLADKGVSVHIGAHGQREGLAAHWEMWSLAQGGMSPIEVLNAATIAAAKHLGMDKDIGSISVGKLADLVILNQDVSKDIYKTDDIEMIMLNGRLYNAKTLNEKVTGNWINAPYYWTTQK